MKLHVSLRSSSASRVRIALNLKGIAYEMIPHQGSRGDFDSPDYRKLNPQGLVPALEHDGHVLVQSMAILEYLEETYPEPALMPRNPVARARVRGLAQVITSDIQPLENIGTLRYLRERLKQDEATAVEWYNFWIAKGFQALELTLRGSAETGSFCHGDSPTLADICLVPQVFNSFRHGLDLTPFPTLTRIYYRALELPAFSQALPEGKHSG
jgi:maleylacetoacetate isomerase